MTPEQRSELAQKASKKAAEARAQKAAAAKKASNLNSRKTGDYKRKTRT
jgi:hypothetical protein